MENTLITKAIKNHNSVGMIKLLIDSGEVPVFVDYKHAILCDYPEALKVLMNFDKSSSLVIMATFDGDGKRSLDFAVESGSIRMVKLICALYKNDKSTMEKLYHINNKENPITTAIKNDRADMVQCLLKYNPKKDDLKYLDLLASSTDEKVTDCIYKEYRSYIERARKSRR